MRSLLSSWLKPHNKKILIVEIWSSCLLLLLIVGGVLFQVNPLVRHVLCPFCATPNSSDIYVTSHTPLPTTPGSNFASDTFLYTIDAQAGAVKHVDNLHTVGGVSYQTVMNGISYEVVSNGVSVPLGTKDIVIATRLRDGETLWSDILGPGYIDFALATPAVLYLDNESELLAINLKSGMQIWDYYHPGGDIAFDTTTFLIQETGDNIIAVSADNGHTIWGHFLNDSNGFIIAPVADENHVFFGYATAQQPNKIFEYDKSTGKLLGQRTLNTGESIFSLHIENHELLIETAMHILYVVRESDMSVIWSYTFSSAYAQQHQQQNDSWVYSADIVYGLSSEINPQTFATNRVMRAWQISNGEMLFQISLDLAGQFTVDRMQNQLIFTSTNNTYPGDKMYNDVEVRQAQTGALLWHKHLGQLPAQNKGFTWSLTVIDAAELQSDEFGYTTYYLPTTEGLDQSLLYITLYRDDTDAHILYALDMQSGDIHWQVNPDSLNTNVKLHISTETPVATPTRMVFSVPTPTPNNGISCPAPTASDPEGTAQIAEFSLPAATSQTGNSPQGITVGPDGNLWFTEFYGQRIGRITPTGTITEFPIPVIHYYPFPEEIAAGPDGNLWFTENQTNKIGRISTSGNITQFAIPTADSGPVGITAGPDGNLWFTESAGNGQIGRITPEGKITQFPVPGAGSMPYEITAGPDGNLWYTDSFSEIGRITPEGKITNFPISTNGSTPEEITAGPDGNLWFTMSGGQTDEIGRITPDGRVTEFPVPSSGCNPLGITKGPDGNLWFTEYTGNQIGRMMIPR